MKSHTPTAGISARLSPQRPSGRKASARARARRVAWQLARCVGAGLAPAWLAATPAVAQQTTPDATLPPVEVIGTSPLPGQGVDRNQLPYQTHVYRRDRLEKTQPDNLLDFMSRNVPGAQVNDIQGSPFQGDLTYRGFRASPLLGAGQGISVYLDGVRINEPFGDVINWDLLPEFSINSLTLVPGANPAFGLNSLGGALAFTTHDGRSAPGLRAELSAGSFGRKRVDLAYGREYESGWHSYIAGSVFDEDGWRDHSDGRLGTVLAKVGRVSGPTEWDVGLLYGRSKLIGNGLVPAYTLAGDGDDDDDGGRGREGPNASARERPSASPGNRTNDLYDYRRESVYTYPDETRNRLVQVTANLRHQLDASTLLTGLVYLRDSSRKTINGDEAEEVDPDEPDLNASFNRTDTEQTGYGFGLGLSGKHGIHQWQIGTTLDASRTRYEQLEQEGFFTPDRGVIAGDEPAELSARVKGRSLAVGLFGTDTVTVTPSTFVTGTLRLNRTRVENTLTSVDDDTGDVEARPTETFNYTSANPALGIAHKLAVGPTLFANLARNTRVPTVIELGCADPEEPCRLPAGLQADPYLKQVKSTSFEAGARWTLSPNLRMAVSAYRTNSRDDILFRSTSVAGQLGYFQNFDRTRNQGVDAELQARLGPVDLSVAYSYLKATYEADGVLRQGERNVVVRPGTRIAGLPKHTLKLGADTALPLGFSLGGDLVAVTRRPASGNEDLRVEDGSDEAIDVSLPGYAIFNLRAAWKPQGAPGWEVFAKVNNVFDRRYETYAAVAETLFSPTGAYVGDESDAVFVAPGAPRAVFVGVRFRY